MTQATYTFRVDESLKEAFASIAQANDRSGAQLLRDFMRRYVQEHADTLSQGGRRHKGCGRRPRGQQ